MHTVLFAFVTNAHKNACRVAIVMHCRVHYVFHNLTHFFSTGTSSLQHVILLEYAKGVTGSEHNREAQL